MLLIRISSPPNSTAGLSIAQESPDSRSSRSSTAFPRKYSKGEFSEGFVMLTCTTRGTPAARAAINKTRVFSTACE